VNKSILVGVDDEQMTCILVSMCKNSEISVRGYESGLVMINEKRLELSGEMNRIDGMIGCGHIREGKFNNYVMIWDRGGGMYLVDVMDRKVKKRY
jgi:hypothetical protein